MKGGAEGGAEEPPPPPHAPARNSSNTHQQHAAEAVCRAIKECESAAVTIGSAVAKFTGIANMPKTKQEFRNAVSDLLLAIPNRCPRGLVGKEIPTKNIGSVGVKYRGGFAVIAFLF